MAKENKEKEVVQLDKKEVHKYIDEQVKKYFSDEIDKANKKVIRYKNRKIIFRNIIIILLIVCILYLLHILYTLNYFDGTVIENKTEVVQQKKTEKSEPSLDELKNKYSKYLDEIEISENSEYIKDYYEGNLSNKLKLYLALNNIDFKEISTEDSYNIIEEDLLKKEYNKLFSDYKAESFNYNGIEIKYIAKLKSYITDDVLTKEESKVVREIVDIKENGKQIEITTIEGVVKDGVLYNNKTYVDDYNEDDSLTNYEKYLNKIVYVFDDKKLKEIK